MTPDIYFEERARKLEEIRRMGINPYPYSFDVKNKSTAIHEKYNGLENGAHTHDIASVAGRIMTIRKMGKASFATVQDENGRIQFYIREDSVGEEAYKFLKLLDIGDMVGVKGEVMRTKMGEVSIFCKEITLLTKSFKPLPEKYHGIADIEIKYRQRYLDLIMDPASREIFKKRTKILTEIRNFLNSRGFLEVETPVLQPIYGGAAARPFKTHHNALDIPLYMKISPELYLKRLIVGGFEKVYDLNKNFRNEGIDRSHNPEFTMLEWYEAYTDYFYQMNQFEELICHLAKTVTGGHKITYQGTEIDLTPPWKRIKMKDAVREYAGIDYEKETRESLYDMAKKAGAEIKDKNASKGELLLCLFEVHVEKKLIQPTIVYEYPVETSPLTKISRDTPGFVERFEPYIAGMEVGNAYSELNDALDQRGRLEEQEKRRTIDDEFQPMDEDFVLSLEYGMPPTGGVGVGVERIVMLLTDASSIRDVILFPTMRHGG